MLVFWGPATVLLEDAPAFVAVDSPLVTTAVLELEMPVIDVAVPVALRIVALESAVLIALAEPSLEPRDVGEGDSEVIAVIETDAAVVLIGDETVSEAVTPVTEPAVISTR